MEMLFAYRGEIGRHPAIRRCDTLLGILDRLVQRALEQIVGKDELGRGVVMGQTSLEGEDDLLVALHVFAAVDVPGHLPERSAASNQRVPNVLPSPHVSLRYTYLSLSAVRNPQSRRSGGLRTRRSAL